MDPLIISHLLPGEDALWHSCHFYGPRPLGWDDSFTHLPHFRAEAYLLARRGNCVVGRMESILVEPHEAILGDPMVMPGEDVEEVARALLEKGMDVTKNLKVEKVMVLLQDRLPYLNEVAAFLPSLGFSSSYQKALYEMVAGLLPVEVSGPAANYRVLSGPSDLDASRVLGDILSQPVSREDEHTDAKHFLEELYAIGTDRVIKGEMALAGGEPIGLVLPGWLDKKEKTASIAYVGIVPKARGKGLGLILYHHGLAKMKAAGARKFIDSTDVQNHSMRKIFER